MHQALNDCLTGWNDLGKAFCGYAGDTFVQSALLVILLFAFDVLWRKRVRAVFRYCVWLLVLLKLVLPPTLSLPTGIGYWVADPLPVATVVSERISLPPEQGPPERHPPAAPQPSGALPTVQPSTEAMAPAAPAAPTVVPLPSLTWQAVVLLFWIAGVLAFVALLAQRLRFVRGLVAASTPAEGELLGLLEECTRQMGVRRPVRLRTLDTLPSPAVCGLWRPTILMPAALVEKLSSDGLQTALLHELAHIRRADLWVNVVQTFLQIVYFYNPFVWLANAVIRRTCEEAVDETVLVTLGGRARNYSNTLIDISEIAFWKADFGLRLVGVAESKRLLQGRIKHMLTRPIPKSARIGTLGTIMILVVAAVLLPMARGTQVRQGETPSLMDRVQREDDPELAELIRTAVANHPGASEKEILEITRRVTQGRAQILLLDEQIAQIAREIEATPASAEGYGRVLLARKKDLETKRMTEMANLREVLGVVPKVPFDKQPTRSLNAWVSILPIDTRVLVLDALKPFSDDWAMERHAVAGLLSEKEALDYVRGRLNDKDSLPLRVEIYYKAETNSTCVRLREAILSLARDANAGMQTEVSLRSTVPLGSGESPIFIREGKIRTFYPRPMRRPDGGPKFLDSGVVDPNDLEQHILWRLTKPKNLPLRFRIEHDEASAGLARQVADTARAVARRLDVMEVVEVTETLVEAVPDTALLGRWESLGKGYLQAIDIQAGGVCQVVMGDRSEAFQSGMRVKGTWQPTVREVLIDINERTRGKPPYFYLGHFDQKGSLVIDRTEIYSEGNFMFAGVGQTSFLKVPPQSERARTELESKPTPERARLPEPVGSGPRSPFGELSTATLNAWVPLQVLEQRVVVLDTLKPFDDQWSSQRHRVIGALSEKETLDYLRGRFQDKKSLPIRVHIYYGPEMKSASEDLGRQIFALARAANVDRDTEVRLEPSVWVGSGESPFYLREGQIRTFYPRPMPRPDGGPEPIASGLVDPKDLEQHILWRLAKPKNLPLTFRIEYDQASSTLAKQVADTAKAVTQRVGLTDLVKVAGVLVESVPESAFLGKWQALGRGIIQSVDIQPGGVCQALVGEGSRTLRPGTTVTGTWVWTAREIQLNIHDPIAGTLEQDPLYYAYRATVNEESNLVIEKGQIYPQGSFMPRPPQMILRKVSPPSEPAKTELESKPMPARTGLREATGITPPLPFAKLPVASLNARVSLQVLEQQVLVLEALKPLSEYWARARYTPVGLLSENDTLDDVQRRLKDQRSLPLRIDIYYRPETDKAAQRLHEKIAALARETNADTQTDLRRQVAVDTDSGVSTFFLREGRIRTFHPDPVRRPDGDPNLLASGVVEVKDLEQHILWRLLHPGNVPLMFRVEYDEASSKLARQVADTAKAVAKRVGLADLVNVTGALVEPVPETVFLGRWQAVAQGAMQTIDIQPRGVCLITMDKGTQLIKPGANVPGLWLPTTKEIIIDIRDRVPDKAHYVYRVSVDTQGNLLVDRGVIYMQGSFHNSDLQPAVFRKVQ